MKACQNGSKIDDRLTPSCREIEEQFETEKNREREREEECESERIESACVCKGNRFER